MTREHEQSSLPCTSRLVHIYIGQSTLGRSVTDIFFCKNEKKIPPQTCSSQAVRLRTKNSYDTAVFASCVWYCCTSVGRATIRVWYTLYCIRIRHVYIYGVYFEKDSTRWVGYPPGWCLVAVPERELSCDIDNFVGTHFCKLRVMCYFDRACSGIYDLDMVKGIGWRLPCMSMPRGSYVRDRWCGVLPREGYTAV